MPKEGTRIWNLLHFKSSTLTYFTGTLKFMCMYFFLSLLFRLIKGKKWQNVEDSAEEDELIKLELTVDIQKGLEIDGYNGGRLNWIKGGVA